MTTPAAARQPGLLRFVLLATVLGTSLAMLPGIAEPIMLPKATFLVLGALLLLAGAGLRAARTGRLELPVSRTLWLLGALLAAMAVVTVLSSESGTSLVGRYARYAGLVPYAAYAVLLVAVVLLYRRRSLTSLTWTLLGALAVVLGYAVLQVLGLDPVGWRTSGRNEPVFAMMGNTNFASAYAGILVPLALAAALDRRTARALRVLAAVLALGGFVYTLRLQAIQGPVVALLGSAFVLLAHGDVRAVVRAVRERRRWQVGLGAGLLVGLAATWRLGSFVAADLPNSLHQRTQLWSAAWKIFLDHPVAGVGLDGYAYYFSAYRPVSHAVERGVAFIDAPHQVPLGMLAQGGLLVGPLYLAFVVAVGAVLVRGLRRSERAERLVLAGYGGAWLAYQVQSLVSIDVPPVALLHFVTAGAILAVAAPPALRTVGAPRTSTPLRLAGAVAVLLLVAPALLFALRPLAADVAAGAAVSAARDGEADQAREWARDAVTLNPLEPSYHRALGSRLASTDPETSRRAFERAAEMERGSVRYARDPLRLAQEAGDEEAERYWQDELARRDPFNRRLVVTVADFHLAAGRVERARELYAQLHDLYPDDPVVQRGLAQADGR